MSLFTKGRGTASNGVSHLMRTRSIRAKAFLSVHGPSSRRLLYSILPLPTGLEGKKGRQVGPHTSGSQSSDFDATQNNCSRWTWLVNSRVIAKKIKHAGQYSAYLQTDWGPGLTRECPNCKHRIDNNDVIVEWPGLPAGVKFDPSDLELLEHLAGKIGMEKSKLHPLIDEFIPTLQEDEGICYTHPENLPGVKKDGGSAHFFHRTSNAYSTGHRKRRKIQKGHTIFEERVRWHKTGKTRSILENGIQKGCKKIMVLYKTSKKSRPDKTNWVMHQYHLGIEEDEKDGQLVVSKIFYQQGSMQTDKNDIEIDLLGINPRSVSATEEHESHFNRVGPRTPKTTTPDLPRHNTLYAVDEVGEDISTLLPDLELTDSEANQMNSKHLDMFVNNDWLAGESQAAEDPVPINIDTSLQCDEVLDSFFDIEEGKKHPIIFPESISSSYNVFDNDCDIFSGISDLDIIGLDTPPAFSLSDLQFCSQESLQNLLDRL